MSRKSQSNDQNLEVKTEPWLVIIELGRSWCQTITSRITLASPRALMMTLTGS